MIFAPTPIGRGTLPADVLEADKKSCVKAGPCGAGKKALYLGSRYLERRYYLPWAEVTRVFKRVAMSQGGFTGKGVFGSLTYLVVVYGNGLEKQCRFKYEADVDRLLEIVEREHPEIPTHSKNAEKKLAEAKRIEEARYLKELAPDAAAAVESLREDIAFLEKNEELTSMLAASAKQKRIIDGMSPAFRIGGAVFGVLGILSALYGLSGLILHRAYSFYFIIGGAAVFFMTLSTNTFPNRWNSKKTAQRDWESAVEKLRTCLEGRPSFSVPAQFAHPIVLERMIRVLREGRAENEAQALEIMKEDLKALNASVTVSQREHDEVVRVKPLFLVCDYRNDLAAQQ